LTLVELIETAIAMRAQLLLRARELTHHYHDAEDLVQDVYVVLVVKPPEPKSEKQTLHWLRLVMRNRFIDAQRRGGDHETDVPLELLQGW
jgi:DNA-directed RNA polymerase specialized sigma24 family protein